MSAYRQKLASAGTRSSFEVAMSTGVYFLAGLAFGAIVSGSDISKAGASFSFVCVTGAIVLFYGTLTRRISGLENHLRGLALVCGGVLTGFGVL